MKIKHAIYAEQADIDMLLEVYKAACLASYSTVEEQTAAIKAAEADLSIKLDTLLMKAFKYGKKIGKSKADEKDAVMYSVTEGTASS
jgi:hypothetical protein